MSKALVVIDVQKGMFDPNYPPYDGEAVVDRIAALIGKRGRQAFLFSSCSIMVKAIIPSSRESRAIPFTTSSRRSQVTM